MPHKQNDGQDGTDDEEHPMLVKFFLTQLWQYCEMWVNVFLL